VVEHRQLGQGRRALLRGGRLTQDLTAFYEAGYDVADAAEAERLGRWRALGARTKAGHVVELCSRVELRPGTLVDIGCGDGSVLAALAGWVPVMDGFELSPRAVGFARARGIEGVRRIESYDGVRVPAGDGAYDLAVLSHVLEHVPDPLVMLREAARVASWVLVEVPLERNVSAARPGKRAESVRIGHLHAFDRGDVGRLVGAAGLEVVGELADPLSFAELSFFGHRGRAAVKWAVRSGLHGVAPRVAERWFTVHYAVLARARSGA
jgi:SAM-dependent methyltransferase